MVLTGRGGILRKGEERLVVEGQNDILVQRNALLHTVLIPPDSELRLGVIDIASETQLVIPQRQVQPIDHIAQREGVRTVNQTPLQVTGGLHQPHVVERVAQVLIDALDEHFLRCLL